MGFPYSQPNIFIIGLQGEGILMDLGMRYLLNPLWVPVHRVGLNCPQFLARDLFLFYPALDDSGALQPLNTEMGHSLHILLSLGRPLIDKHER